MMCPSDPDSGLLNNNREPACSSYLGDCTSRTLGQSYSPSGGPIAYETTCRIAVLSPNINCIQGNGGSCRDLSSYAGFDGYNNFGAPGMFSAGCRAFRIRDCTDGTSNTFLMGESLPIYTSFLYYISTVYNVASTNTPPNYYKFSGCQKTTVAATRSVPGGSCADGMVGFNSMHTGGVHMCMSDGSVRFIGENIDYATWNYLGNRSEGQVVGEF